METDGECSQAARTAFGAAHSEKTFHSRRTRRLFSYNWVFTLKIDAHIQPLALPYTCARLVGEKKWRRLLDRKGSFFRNFSTHRDSRGVKWRKRTYGPHLRARSLKKAARQIFFLRYHRSENHFSCFCIIQDEVWLSFKSWLGTFYSMMNIRERSLNYSKIAPLKSIGLQILMILISIDRCTLPVCIWIIVYSLK
jgi:hypothetical protein